MLFISVLTMKCRYCLALCLVFFALHGAAFAAPTTMIPDTIARRAMACSHCHAAQDKKLVDAYYPRLAGKPQAYLYHQMKNFQSGRRQHPLMMHMLSNLPDSYLQELAEYFSQQQAQYRAAQVMEVDSASLLRGKQLASLGDANKKIPACAACHGTDLLGRQPAIPGLIGLPREYMAAQLGAWKNQTRKAHAPDCMAELMASLSENDISAVAAWLAAQDLPAAKPDVQIAQPIRLPMRCGSQEAK